MMHCARGSTKGTSCQQYSRGMTLLAHIHTHFQPEPGSHTLQAPRGQQLLLRKAVHPRPVCHPQRHKAAAALQPTATATVGVVRAVPLSSQHKEFLPKLQHAGGMQPATVTLKQQASCLIGRGECIHSQDMKGTDTPCACSHYMRKVRASLLQ